MDDLLKDLKIAGDPAEAKHHQNFFKTKKGQYGANDIFWGVRVPEVRKTAKQHRDLSLKELDRMLDHEIHEVRQTALFIMADQFDRTEDQAIYNLYIKKSRQGRVNNWDLVDDSAHKIMGRYLYGRDRTVAFEFADSGELWLQRIAMIASYYWIKQNDFADTLKLADKLLSHEHDLIHKAVGWMLREVGNRDKPVEVEFLRTRYKVMPRTMLRYAIEKFAESNRRAYLKGRV